MNNADHYIVSTLVTHSALHRRKFRVRSTLSTDKGLAPAGTLTVTEVTDEDGIRSLTFTDGRGRTVMTRTGPDGDFSDTRFVYNGFDDLLCVLPPMLADRDYAAADWEIKKYAYLYTYDGRGQCTSKRLPGRGELRMRYDPAGRLVATQDGNQRKVSSWTVYMFDRFGREALTADAGASDEEIALFASRLNSVSYTGDPEFAGYTPAVGLPFTMTVATAEYYDDYGFTSMCKYLRPDASAAASVMSSPTGLRTGGYSGGERFETVYYDTFGRPVFSAADTGVGVAVTTTEYTYSGQVRKTVSSALGTDVTTRYNYDSADRPIGVWSDLDGLLPCLPMTLSAVGPVIDTPVTPVDGTGDMSAVLNYGKTGALERARFGGKVSQSVTRDCGGREISRTVSLPFAVRVPDIATMSLPGVETGGGATMATNDITEVLKYADAAVPAFNGNVGERVYADASWSYHYDAHNRLTKADYKPAAGGKENFSTMYTYDRQANITRLKKYGLIEPLTGEYGVIDDLFLAYEGNQAVRVEDFADELVYEGAGGFNAPDGVGEMVMHPYGYFDGEGKIRYYLHDFQGNVTMVVDGDGEVLQHSRYYPYGEAIDVFAASQVGSGASATDRVQPYLYGGKELERMHGLGEYDYGARRLQSHLPMWTTQDPCLEKYFPTSPYAYCAGNPIRFTDPDGCTWTEESLGYIKKFLEDLQRRKDKAKQQFIELLSGVLSGNVDIANVEKTIGQAIEQLSIISECNTVMDEVSLLNESSQLYHIQTDASFGANVLTPGNNKGGITYDDKTDKVVITLRWFSSNMLSHELKHAYQFEMGEYSFGRIIGGAPYCDKQDEYAAYRRQELFGEPRVYKLDSFYDNYSDESLSVEKDLQKHPGSVPEELFLQRKANSTYSIIRWKGKTYISSKYNKCK